MFIVRNKGFEAEGIQLFPTTCIVLQPAVVVARDEVGYTMEGSNSSFRSEKDQNRLQHHCK